METKILYETMTRLVLDSPATPSAYFVVRVWRSAPVPSLGPDFHIVNEVTLCHKWCKENNLNMWDMMKTIMERVAGLDRVEAVEVLDDNGNGGLIYPKWP